MRALAFELLRRVAEDDSYANLLLPKLLSDAKVDSRDAGFIQELAFGTLRNKLLYEKVIETSLSKGNSHHRLPRAYCSTPRGSSDSRYAGSCARSNK